MVKYVFFITGASGTGKTSLVEEIKSKYSHKNWAFLHFDSTGVPTLKEMIKESGSVENWQRDQTFKWIKKMLSEYKEKEVIIFEGQSSPKFIKEGFSQNNFSNYKIILVDCNKAVMTKRLTEDRKQPELLTEAMKNWLKHLRRQAKESGAKIINTSNKTKAEVLQAFEKILREVYVLL